MKMMIALLALVVAVATSAVAGNYESGHEMEMATEGEMMMDDAAEMTEEAVEETSEMTEEVVEEGEEVMEEHAH